jgi:VCBS repeat-containing protein
MKNSRRRVGRTDKSTFQQGRASLGRILRAEALEQRQLMAGDVGTSAHHNSWYGLDVNNDLRVTPMDALVVLNDLNRAGIRSLDGEAVNPSKFIDVNADGKLSALDALQVINALNRGEGEDVPVVEVMLGLTDDAGNSLLNPGTRTADLSVGDIVNLEILYTDARRFGNGLGLFTVYTDIIASQTGILEPLVTETQVLTLSENFVDSTSGFVTLTQEGSMVISEISFDDIAASPTNAIRNALINDFGYAPEEIFTSLETREPRAPNNPVGDPFDIYVRFLGDRFIDADVPNLSIDASTLVTSNGSEVVGSSRQIDPRLPDGTINPVAVGFSLDTRSRTGQGTNVYTNVRQGSFNDDPTDGILDGFSSIGATGQLNAGGLPSILASVGGYQPQVPFEAFSIRVRLTQAIQDLQLQLQIPLEEQNNPNDPVETVLVIYGNRQDGTSGDERGLSPAEVVVDDDGRITINVNDQITARPDNLSVAEDGTQTINPLTNDLNQGTAPLTIVGKTDGANGTVTFTSNSVTYTPAANYFGSDTFTYTVQNGDGDQAVGTVNVTVDSVNDPPTAQGFAITVTEGNTRVLANSEFISRSSAGPANENQTPVLTDVGNAGTRGTVTLNADGSVTYVAPVAYEGPDSFTYTITDSVATVTATVSVNVADQNDPPVAMDDTISVVEDTAVTYTAAEFRANILANDTPGPQNEIDNGQTVTLAANSFIGSMGGTLVQNTDGTVTYTPPANVFGTAAETIVYTITDGELTDSATITVNIQGVNDAPIAVDDPDVTIDELTTDQLVDVLANDSAGPLENATQTISIARIVTLPTNGLARVSDDRSQILYTPNTDFTGTDTLTYVIVDSLGLESNTATATIEVVPVIRPRAKNDTFMVAEDSATTTLNIIGNDLANEGETVVLDTVGTISATQGTLVRSGDTVQFTPAADFFGSVSFTYTISDTSNPVIDTPEEIASATGTVTINVTAVNDAPVFVADNVLAATEDTPLTIPGGTLTANDLPGPANESGQTVSISAVTAVSAQGGTVSLDGQTITYTPRTDYNGSDTFTYTIRDSEGATSQATASLSIAAVNDAPVLNLATGLTATEDQTISFSQSQVLGTSLPGPATATDESSQTLSIVSVGTGGATQFGGAVSLSGGMINYRPSTDYFGPDSFAVTVRDSAGAETVGTVTLSVAPVNDPPVFGDPRLLAFNKSVATYTQAQLVAASTVGPPNETGTVVVTSATATAATTGTITFDPATGSVSYRAATDFVGLDTFRITISDGELTATGMVTVDVREFEPSTVRGSVFFDYIESIENPVRNGQQESHEPGLQMARVHLVSTAAENVTGVDVNTQLFTDANGQFEFTNVPPGTYRVRFDLPVMVHDGNDIPGSLGDLDSVMNQFTFEIPEPGGFVAEDYNFTLLSFTGRAGNALDLMVSSYLASNPTIANDTQNGLLGAKAFLDASGMTQWFVPKRGFEDVRYGEINVDRDGTVATMTVVLDNGDMLSGVIPESRRVILRDSSGGYVVQVFGSVDSFGLMPDSAFNQGDLGLMRYQEAVDMLLGQDGNVL